MSVGYLLGAIVVLHIVIIAAQKFLGPLETSSAVLSEEALRARNVALYGQAGKGEVDDTVVDVNDEVDTCPMSLCKHPCSLHYAFTCMPNDVADAHAIKQQIFCLHSSTSVARWVNCP